MPRNAGQNRKSVETQGPGWLVPMANPEIIPYKAFSPLGKKKTSEKAKAKETKRTGHRDLVASAISLSIRTLTLWFSKPTKLQIKPWSKRRGFFYCHDIISILQ